MYADLNGTLRDAGELGIHPGDRGLTLGDGVFETIAVRAGRAQRLAAHLDRLHGGLATLAFETVPAREALQAAVDRVIAANALETGVVRLTVTRGAAARGLAPQGGGPPTVLVTASDALPPADPVTAVISTRVRRNEHSPTSGLKSLSYLDNVLARQEAAERGAGEALLRNTAGHVVEATVANVFAVIHGELCTPPLADGALPGVLRAAILAAEPVRETHLTRADLLRADEVILTNSLSVRPVVALDGHPIGAGVPGPWHERLRGRTASV
jgi:branched-chain amino acid aminotransferase